MNIPFFSIVMPAYNCADTITGTLNSLQQQKWTDFECIIVNDGSTDNTREVIEAFCESDSRIKIINKLNDGPGSARNDGIASAMGKYLYLMDSDDLLSVHALEIYAKKLINNDPDLIVSSYQMNVMDDQKIVDERIVQVKDEWIGNHEEFLTRLHDYMEKQLMYVIWNKVYSLEIIREHSITFPPYSSCEDRLFNIQYFHFVEKVQILSDVLYHYSFEGKSSLTNRFLPNKFETFEEFYLKLIALTDKNQNITSALFLKGTMSCIIPLHSQECPYTLVQKLKNIYRILNNDNIKIASRNSSTNSSMRIIMSLLFRSRSVVLNYSASLIMYKISQISPRLIEKLKGKF